jgi:putative endonuclease
MTGLPLGRHWEAVAAEHLEQHGLSIVARGYRCRLGELDIVCTDGHALIVVEVRARSRGGPCSAVETIGRHKRRRIVQATRHLLMRNSRFASAPIRFDVIAFDAIDTASAQLRWIKNAFDAG